jgi:hypothetical protein
VSAPITAAARIERVFHWQTYSDRPTRRRRWLATGFFLLSALSTYIGVDNWTHPVSRSHWRFIGVALACVMLGVGIEQGREWARWFSAALGLLVGALSLWVTGWMIADAIHGPRWDLALVIGVWVLLAPGPSIAAAVYCFLPATRNHFASVREARARARAVAR